MNKYTIKQTDEMNIQIKKWMDEQTNERSFLKHLQIIRKIIWNLARELKS